jgi:hypothetical protein
MPRARYSTISKVVVFSLTLFLARAVEARETSLQPHENSMVHLIAVRRRHK